jgi:hypothetical protein
MPRPEHFSGTPRCNDTRIQSGSTSYPQVILLLNNLYRILGLSLSGSGFQPPKTIPGLSPDYAQRGEFFRKPLALDIDMRRNGLPLAVTGLSRDKPG